MRLCFEESADDDVQAKRSSSRINSLFRKREKDFFVEEDHQMNKKKARKIWERRAWESSLESASSIIVVFVTPPLNLSTSFMKNQCKRMTYSKMRVPRKSLTRSCNGLLWRRCERTNDLCWRRKKVSLHCLTTALFAGDLSLSLSLSFSLAFTPTVLFGYYCPSTLIVGLSLLFFVDGALDFLSSNRLVFCLEIRFLMLDNSKGTYTPKNSQASARSSAKVLQNHCLHNH
jgi:hypothetical protein